MSAAAKDAPCTMRVGRPGDAATLSALHGQAFAAGWDEASIAGFLADPACVTLTALRVGKGEITGFITARIADAEAEILTLTVAAGARRKGVARALVTALVDALRTRGVAELFLEVGADNDAARGLYAGAGFAEAGRRPGYYAAQPGGAPRDALVLRLAI